MQKVAFKDLYDDWFKSYDKLANWQKELVDIFDDTSNRQKVVVDYGRRQGQTTFYTEDQVSGKKRHVVDLKFEDGVLSAAGVKRVFFSHTMYRKSALVDMSTVSDINNVRLPSLIRDRHDPAKRHTVLDEFRTDVRNLSVAAGIVGSEGGLIPPALTFAEDQAIDALRIDTALLPPIWTNQRYTEVQAQIQVSRGRIWLHTAPRTIWTRDPTDPPHLYISATAEEIAAFENGERTDVVANQIDDPETPSHYRVVKLPLVHDDKVAAQPRMLIDNELAERLYPYINPFSFYQLSVPPNRRDLAPPIDDFDYHCAYAKEDVKLGAIRDLRLTGLKKKLDKHQIESLNYALTGDDTYIADDAGTGKTTTALAYATCIGAMRTLIIGPSSSKYNWENEIKATLRGSSTVVVIDASDAIANDTEALRNYLRTSFASVSTASTVQPLFVVINYDILSRVIDVFNDVRWDLLIVDEAKRLQYDNSARSLFINGGIKGKYKKTRLPGLNAAKRLYMDGTPINKPYHFWPIVRAFDPLGLGADKKAFCDRYCGAYVDQHGQYHESGPTNLERVRELGEICRQRFMVRHSDAVLNLKPCVEEVVFIEVEDRAALETAERNAIFNAIEKLRLRDKDGGDAQAREIMSEVSKRGGGDDALRDVVGQHFGEQLTNAKARGPLTAVLLEEMATVRKNLGAAKIKPALDFILKYWIDHAYDPVLVFGHHKKEVVKKLTTELGDMMVQHLIEAAPTSNSARALLDSIQDGTRSVTAEISGDVSAKKKTEITRMFQDGKLFAICANMAAAGEALTLTATNAVFFVETDWNATTMRQARKRAHRRGQQEQVYVYLLFVDQSFDYTVVSKFLLKRDVQDAFFGEGMWGGGSGDDLDDDDDG